MNRLKEPSTWAGIAGVLLSLAPVTGPAAPYLGALAGVAGTVAMVLRERPKP